MYRLSYAHVLSNCSLNDTQRSRESHALGSRYILKKNLKANRARFLRQLECCSTVGHYAGTGQCSALSGFVLHFELRMFAVSFGLHSTSHYAISEPLCAQQQ
jgi:hypothetical protein